MQTGPELSLTPPVSHGWSSINLRAHLVLRRGGCVQQARCAQQGGTCKHIHKQSPSAGRDATLKVTHYTDSRMWALDLTIGLLRGQW